MQKTNIGYLTHTWNPIAMKCTPVSEGCKNCWHIKMAKRLSGAFKQRGEDLEHVWRAYDGGDPALLLGEVGAPVHFIKPLVIGVQFMGDLFHKKIPREFIERIFMAMYKCKQHTFVILTKRPDSMRKFISSHAFLSNSPLPNVWLGVSVEDQKTANERIPLLLQTPAAKRFVSYEPALGMVDFTNIEESKGEFINSLWLEEGEKDIDEKYGGASLDWIIMGGESGSGARPMHPDWARSVRDQCKAAGVPFFFKQWGEWYYENNRNNTVEHHSWGLFKVGTKHAGRQLDSMEYSEIPK